MLKGGCGAAAVLSFALGFLLYHQLRNLALNVTTIESQIEGFEREVDSKEPFL